MDVLTFIIPLIMTAIAAFFKLKSDDETLTFYRRITFMGIVLSILTLTYFVFGLKNLSDEYSEKQSNKNKIDSLSNNINYLKAKSDSYYDLLNVLGIKLDTTKAESRHQTDSLIAVILSEREKRNIAPLPDLNFCTDAIAVDTIVGNSYSFTYRLCNRLGVANNIQLKLYLAVLQEDGVFKFIKNYLKAFPSKILSTDRMYTDEIGVNLPNVKIEKFYFLLTGTYTNADGTKKQTINNIVQYDLKNQKYGIPNWQYTEIENIFKKNGALK